jgi:hypothetical protein
MEVPSALAALLCISDGMVRGVTQAASSVQLAAPFCPFWCKAMSRTSTICRWWTSRQSTACLQPGPLLLNRPMWTTGRWWSRMQST